MNCSQLSLAMQLKALADAAAYNDDKANIILAKSRHRGMNDSQQRAFKSHMDCHKLFSTEYKRLKDNQLKLKEQVT